MASSCKSAAGFSNNLGYQDEGYFDALVHMFEHVLEAIREIPGPLALYLIFPRSKPAFKIPIVSHPTSAARPSHPPAKESHLL